MVRCGSVFWTVHCALIPQGVKTLQGSRQTSWRQANLLGQSASTRHSGSGSGTEIFLNKDYVLLFGMNFLTKITSSGVWIARVSIIALTPCTMRSDYALCIWCTIARVNTMLIATCEHLRALFVNHTFRFGAGYIGVSSISWRTIAACVVIPTLTESINSTLGQTTGINTVSVDTFVCQRAL